MLIVQKFGGTSLEGRERIFAAARIITQAAKRGSRVVALNGASIVDYPIEEALAMRKTIDTELLRIAYEVNS